MIHLDFVLLRVECCNQYKDTPCRIALVGVRNSRIVAQKEVLIDPEDDEFDFMSSGTTLDDLKGMGSFKQHWNEIYTFIQEYPVMVSTADGYDSDVLFNALRKYHISCDGIPYLTAKNILRRSISTYSYTFDHLCDQLGVSTVDRLPLSFAINWSELIIAACKDKEEDNLLDFARDNRLIVGELSSEQYLKCAIKRIYKAREKTKDDVDETKFDINHPFYGQNVVFTGKLQYFERSDAQSYVERIGGHCPSGLSKATNYLVVGVQSPSQVGADGLSGKQKKAIQYRTEGIEIELLSETDFIDMMGLQDVVDWRKYVDETYLSLY